MFAHFVTLKNVRKAVNVNHVIQVVQFHDKKTELQLIGGDTVAVGQDFETVVRALEAARSSTKS